MTAVAEGMRPPSPARASHGARASSRLVRAAALLLVALSAEACTPTFDTDSTEAFRRSFAEITRRLDGDEQEKLRNAICYLAANGDYGSRHAAEVKGVAKAVKGTLFASTNVVATIVAELGFQDIGGMTAPQVIAAAERQSMKYFQRSPAPLELQLREYRDELRRDSDANIAAAEREIAPEAARLKSQYTLLATTLRAHSASYSTESGHGVLAFELDNMGPMTIRAVQFDVVFQARQSSEPHRRTFAPLHLQDSLAPGRTQHLGVIEPRESVVAPAAAGSPPEAADVSVVITNALVSDGAWIVTVDVAGLEKKRQDVADRKAYAARALDNLDAVEAFLR